MKCLWVLLLIFTGLQHSAQTIPKEKRPSFVLVVQGGAGNITPQNMPPEAEKAYTLSLQQALLAGYALLNNGGSAVDAVEAAVRTLEDNPLFNAGKGAVLTNAGTIELDASIMDGKNKAAGAVAGVTTIKNPVSAARAVMEKSPHVLMAGKGAEQFAAQQGLEIVNPRYFYLDNEWEKIQKKKKTDSLKNDTDKNSFIPLSSENKHGTVGAVALDKAGNLAAATSTGGTSNKKWGRIGDSPIIGAGTYANNATCAISCTGWGEYFIRLVVAKTVSDLMEFKHYTLQQAAEEMILKKVPQAGGDGGLVAVDKNGQIAMPFSTPGMFRGYILPDGKAVIKMYAP